mmetsp:Transcript_23937/g.53880  ORF Transcript_23937/g.53880 Transcript_23937/m.53880 type:complete len:90 (-) Transcript_23937:122-391(-)
MSTSEGGDQRIQELGTANSELPLSGLAQLAAMREKRLAQQACNNHLLGYPDSGAQWRNGSMMIDASSRAVTLPLLEAQQRRMEGGEGAA